MVSVAELKLLITGKNEASAALDGVNKSAGQLGDTLKTTGAVAAGMMSAQAIVGGASRIAETFGSTIRDASDLGESMNAVNVVFGDSSKKVQDFGQDAATSAGLSARAFNQLATPLGAMLQNAGFGADEAAKSTIDLTQRAADLASVFNTDVGDALAAIQAGLRGEADPLEKYGIGLSAAAVEQKALADTGKKSAAELTNQEKAAARVALIFEQSDKVSGDFANTSGGLANQQRILAAQMENFRANLGEKLLPVLTTSLGAFSALPGPLQNIGFGFAAIGPGVIQLATGLGPMIPAITAMGPAFTTAAAGARTLGLAMLTPPLGIIIALVAVGVAAYVFRDQIADAFRQAAAIVLPIIKSISDAVGAALDWVKNNWPAIATILSGPFAPIVALATDAFGVRSAFTGAISSALNWVKDNWPIIATIISGPFAPIVALATDAFGVRTAFVGALGAMYDKAVEWGANVLTFFRNLPGNILTALGNLSELLKNAGADLIRGFVNGMKSIPIPSPLDLVPGGGYLKKAGSLIPFRAAGGPVMAGKPYIVGENGPELFVSRQNGTIVPNGAMAGSGGLALNFYGPVTLGGGGGRDQIASVGFAVAAHMRSRGLRV